MNGDRLDSDDILVRIAHAGEQEIEALHQEYLGRSEGLISRKLRDIPNLPLSERKAEGERLNRLKAVIAEAIKDKKTTIQQEGDEREAQNITLDPTAPQDSVIGGPGHEHPVSAILDDIVRVFWQMGFQVVDGPEIETDWYNFEALNIPPGHPARDMQDTFYLESGAIPRTHTSNVQIRYMENNRPPIRIIAPGKVYRNEDEDARHSWMFNQLEGIVVDRDVTLADLKGTLLAMMHGLIGDKTDVKLLPNYFPYTEPSVEMHATCVLCGGDGCTMCSHTGWLELGGAGMIHPNVLRNVGIDPTQFSGFAFGFGPERIAAIKHNVPDVREFWRPDLSFLEQF